MTDEEFCAARNAIRWSNREIAQQLECSPEIIRRWSKGKSAIPPTIARWLEALAKHHERHPPPTNWRKRS